jgi:energy-coupling factor transporter ATP-binding protein EcfA2
MSSRLPLTRITDIEIRNLHGSINLNFEFHPNLSFLVGINGSGKTTVLNVIDWLLQPDFRALSIENYNLLRLGINYGGMHYTIQANKTNEEMVLKVIGINGEVGRPIRVALHHDSDQDSSREYYHSLSPEKHELNTWNFIKSLGKPIVISLDRTMSAEVGQSKFQDRIRVKKIERDYGPVTPLDRILEVTSEKYAQFRSAAADHDNVLKTRIIMSALQSPSQRHLPWTGLAEYDLDQLEHKVIEYLSRSVKEEDVARHVGRFFRNAKEMTDTYKYRGLEPELIHEFVTNQYRQLENLANAFNEFEQKSAIAFSSLQKFLNAVNIFLRDSNKELFFDEGLGALAFVFLDWRGNRIKGTKSVRTLSSGEKQILILFAFLAFVASPGSIFIIDEPELSLHPKWQEEFMQNFLSLKPDDMQLILATHSPDMIGNYRENCIVLTQNYDH